MAFINHPVWGRVEVSLAELAELPAPPQPAVQESKTPTRERKPQSTSPKEGPIYKGSATGGLTDLMKETLEVLEELGPMSASQLGEYAGIDRGAAGQRLTALYHRANGRVIRSSVGVYGTIDNPPGATPNVMALTANQRRTWEIFENYDGVVSTAAIANHLNITRPAASSRVGVLVNLGLVEQIRRGKYRRAGVVTN
ncbi:helix-turn-helix DNA binding protein [Gordonia phage Cozz]|uniref:Helix-turn-helix DNA binding protein n=1 Tax=Gordonia phage Cozz TaxID=1838066 RepID=A0A160DDF3_9CAUD|nr:helix-turn-helix DNA binding protein [Gordonia phage Cozz]ANA85735.1 helix-turn-helix DNA binding protein [Gordonia phage Cozz]